MNYLHIYEHQSDMMCAFTKAKEILKSKTINFRQVDITVHDNINNISHRFIDLSRIRTGYLTGCTCDRVFVNCDIPKDILGSVIQPILNYMLLDNKQEFDIQLDIHKK